MVGLSLNQTIIYCMGMGSYWGVDDRIADLLLQIVWHNLWMGVQ